MATTTCKVDPILEAAGGMGKYQILQYFITMFATFSASFQLFNFIFIGRYVPHVCKAPVDNSSIFDHVDNSIFYHNNSVVSYAKCSIDVEANISGIAHLISLPCVFGYEYSEGKETSLISDMDIVCDRGPLKGFGQTLLILGQGIGAMSLPVFSDKYGRRPVLLFSHLCFLGLGIGIAFVSNFTVFLVLRVILGIAQQGIVLTMHTISVEMFPARNRKMGGLLGSGLWTVCTSFIALIAYLMQTYSWRTTQLVYCSVSLYVFVQFFVMEESLSWMITNKKKKQISSFLKNATRFNNKDYDTAMNLYITLHESSDKSDTPLIGEKDVVDAVEKDKTKPSFLDLLKRKRLALNVAVLWFIWITDSMTVFGLFMTAHSLAGNRYLNFMLYSVLEGPSVLVFYYMVDRYGRKKTSMALHGVAGVGLIMATVVREIGGDSAWSNICVSVFSCIGMFGSSGAWGVSFFYTPELFPTNLRNFGLGTSSSCARLGGMLAPFASLLAEYVRWAPGTIFGGCCIIATLLVNILPETMGRELPQTLDELEAWHKKSDDSTIPLKRKNNVYKNGK